MKCLRYGYVYCMQDQDADLANKCMFENNYSASTKITDAEGNDVLDVNGDPTWNVVATLNECPATSQDIIKSFAGCG
jgi:hypothetical protein